jgi:hypothetical protein
MLKASLLSYDVFFSISVVSVVQHLFFFTYHWSFAF